MNIKIITLKELTNLIQTHKAIKVVDVLGLEHYNQEHIKGAISLPLAELREKAAQILPDKTQTIVVYCASFTCPASDKAAKVLMSMGYQDILVYKGGIQEYQEAGLPMEGSKHAPRKFQEKASKEKHVCAVSRNITFNNQPLTLVGRKIQVGMLAPNFSAINEKFEKVSLNDFYGKVKVITSFPSLDTPVCAAQIKQCNQRMMEYNSQAVLIGISKDLPFAQQRYQEENNLEDVLLLSDFKNYSFGVNYGLLIKENNLLARSIIIIDDNDIVQYMQIVSELGLAPDYDDAIQNLEKIISRESGKEEADFAAHCEACEGGIAPLEKTKIAQHLTEINEWQLEETSKIVKEFKFKTFGEAKYLLDLLAVIADEQGHHPKFILNYNKLKVELTTHAAKGLTRNDFVMAKIIDNVIY